MGSKEGSGREEGKGEGRGGGHHHEAVDRKISNTNNKCRRQSNISISNIKGGRQGGEVRRGIQREGGEDGEQEWES